MYNNPTNSYEAKQANRKNRPSLRFALKHIGAVMVLMSGGVSSTSYAASTFEYFPPTSRDREANEIKVGETFNVVWNRLVRNLSGIFFVINVLDKESRLINVSFSSDTPSEFIDCGVSSRTFKDTRLSEQTVDYSHLTTDSANFLATSPDGNLLNEIHMKRLAGRINVYVAPMGVTTTVKVNVHYSLNIDITKKNVSGQLVHSSQQTRELTTTSPYEGREPSLKKTIKCRTKFELEKRVLSLVN